MKILLVSHGDFAAGIAHTMRDFFGAQNIYWASVDMEKGTSPLLHKAEAYLSQWGEEEVIICSDIKGGSANQAIFPFIAKPNVTIITGMNLPLLLQLHLEESVTQEELQNIVQNARQEIEILDRSLLCSSSCEEDE